MKVAGVVVALSFALAAPAHAAPELVKLGDFPSPTYATSAPDDGNRIYVVEKAGTIRVAGQAAPFLDLTADTLSSDSERGLLSMAFAPDYATSGRLYVYLTTTPAGEIQIREYRRSAADPSVADPATARPLVSIPHADAANHNGGQLQFGPDGKLYAGDGDGGGGNDQFHHSQDAASLLGKLLTIDTAAGGATIVAKGLRNPWRFSFDRATGQLVIGDVGQDAYEEIDAGLAANYGWPCKEGLHDHGSDRAATASRRRRRCSSSHTRPASGRSPAGTWCAIRASPRFRAATCTATTVRPRFGPWTWRRPHRTLRSA